MGLLSNAGKEAGADAAREIHNAVSEAVPGVAKVAEGLEGAVKDSVHSALDGIADGISQLVGIALRVDGATVQLDGVDIRIVNPRLTLTLGPYKPE